MIQAKGQVKKPASSWRPKFFKSSTVASTAIQKPISNLDAKKTKTNEIFVDIFEKLTVSGIAKNNFLDYLLDLVQLKWNGDQRSHRRCNSDEELLDWQSRTAPRAQQRPNCGQIRHGSVG
jgi:hypothetical protein